MGRNILVVEDDRNISELIQMYLVKEGFDVRIAGDGGQAIEEFQKAVPDLILLDGGKGHVSTVRELLKEKGIVLPVFGMVKDDYHKTRALCTETEEISIAREQDIYGLIYRIQEEVHRYTVGRMESAKRKTLKTSTLTKIPGIGDAKAKKLLKAFGGIGGVKSANVEALEAVSGISNRDALSVWRYYHESNEKQ